MRIIACLIGSLTVLGAPPAKAYFDTGNALYSVCQENGPFSLGQCMGTIVGHYDMMMAMGDRCGNETTKNKQQLRDIVVKYLQENPAQRSDAAASLSFIAFFFAFSCTFPDPVSTAKK